MSQTARAQAVSVGHALDVDATDTGVVHSVFDRAVNLAMRGDLWTILAENKADLPFGMRTTLGNFDALGLQRGEFVSVRSGFVGVASRLVIDCRAAPRWTPKRQRKLEPGLDGRLTVVAAAARDKAWHGSARMAQAIKSAVDDAALGDAVARVIGQGPGATPSGDDVLVGVLAVLTSPASGPAGAAAARSLGRAILPHLPTTTDVSGHLLRQALNGWLGRDLHELVSALIAAPSPHELREKVCRVMETGATSGADTCEGLLAFAPLYFVPRDGRVSS